FVTNEEPTTLGAASANCGGNIQNTVCDDIASDPLTWIDNDTFDNQALIKDEQGRVLLDSRQEKKRSQ
ncbi:MAG: hypothetical protein IH991_10880, partial [Planctomycetes bacterium]|nr:hypothetical protein [Planctomycetota bacterium]